MIRLELREEAGASLGRYNFLSTPIEGQLIHLRDMKKNHRDWQVIEVRHLAAKDENEMPVIQVSVAEVK